MPPYAEQGRKWTRVRAMRKISAPVFSSVSPMLRVGSADGPAPGADPRRYQHPAAIGLPFPPTLFFRDVIKP